MDFDNMSKQDLKDKIMEGVENMKAEASIQEDEEALEVLGDAEVFIEDEKPFKAISKLKKAKEMLSD